MLEWLDVMFYALASSYLGLVELISLCACYGRRAVTNMSNMDQDRLRLDLEYIIMQRELPEGERLGDVLARLDAVAALPEIDSRLEHYLAKRSYVKALQWLDNPELPHQK